MAVLIFGTICIIGLFAANLIIEKPLYEMGLNILYKYQQIPAKDSFKVFNNSISTMISSFLFVTYILIYLLLSKRKLLILTHISFIIICEYITSILKQTIQQPRPFWYNDKILNFQSDCPKDFGNPSGHILRFIVLF